MNRFEIFGTSHIIVLILTVLVSLPLIYIVRNYKSVKAEKICNYTLLTLIIITTILSLYNKYQNGWLTVTNDIPFHLCDWATITVIITLIKKNIFSYELSYFWGLGGTLQALLTPEMSADFPSPSFILFFAIHSLIIISVLYFTFGLRMRPKPKSILRVFLWSQVYMACALGINYLVDANFGFLIEKPVNASLFDYLGPWPYYLISLEFVALISYCIYYSPFYIYDKFFKSD